MRWRIDVKESCIHKIIPYKTGRNGKG